MAEVNSGEVLKWKFKDNDYFGFVLTEWWEQLLVEKWNFWNAKQW